MSDAILIAIMFGGYLIAAACTTARIRRAERRTEYAAEVAGEARCDTCGNRMCEVSGPEPRACGTTCAECPCDCPGCTQHRADLRADLERKIERESA